MGQRVPSKANDRSPTVKDHFWEFVNQQVLTEQSPDCHWLSQSLQCGLAETRIKYNFFKVENRTAWSNRFTKKFGLGGGVRTMGGVSETTRHKCPGYQCSAGPLMEQYYTVSLFD